MKATDIQIIIPMSGFGERFRRAGYKVPKPLIDIDNQPIIAHVINMFPGENDFLFICNENHLANPTYNMRNILKKHCPSGRIVGIPAHKLGPVHAVLQVKDLIDPNRPVIVNYCDFTCYWNWQHFKNFVSTSSCQGAVSAYKGFHPHTLGSTYYAYIKQDQGWMIDIQEKQPYTDNRMEEYASSGAYYFSSGNLMIDSFQYLVDRKLLVGGEYYVSLVYKSIIANGGKVAVYPLQHFMQWGTPDDVMEYKKWSNSFQKLIEKPKHLLNPSGVLIMPMAGLGKRFSN